MSIVVAVGSTNPVKVNAVKKVFQEVLHEDIIAVPVSVESGVGSQPVGLEATIKGAVNRAKNAIRVVNDAKFGVGIEAGLVKMPFTITGYVDVQFCAICDDKGTITIGAGPGFEYPPIVVKRVLERGEEVGNIMDEISGVKNLGKKQGAIGFLSKNLMNRQRLTEIAVLMALVPRMNPNLYFSEDFR